MSSGVKEERGEGDTNSLPREDEEDNWVDIKPLDGEACGQRGPPAQSKAYGSYL